MPFLGSSVTTVLPLRETYSCVLEEAYDVVVKVWNTNNVTPTCRLLPLLAFVLAVPPERATVRFMLLVVVVRLRSLIRIRLGRYRPRVFVS